MATNFLGKAKTVAQQAVGEARRGLEEGQTKLDEFQAKRQTDKLLAELGNVSYAARRGGGSQQAVDDAIAALDEHGRQVNWIGFPPGSGGAQFGGTGTPPPPTPPTTPPVA